MRSASKRAIGARSRARAQACGSRPCTRRGRRAHRRAHRRRARRRRCRRHRHARRARHRRIDRDHDARRAPAPRARGARSISSRRHSASARSSMQLAVELLPPEPRAAHSARRSPARKSARDWRRWPRSARASPRSRGSAISFLSSGIGRGVVVTTWRGLRARAAARTAACPRSLPARRHLASSSHQAASNCGPRKTVRLLGREHLRDRAVRPDQPAASTARSAAARRGGCTASRPDTPSIITARTSASVSPTSAMRACRRWRSAARRAPCARTHSAPARVLPAPRPPRISQVLHGPPPCAAAGGN